ncbi:DUF5707 domain-containing protein [Streptomyces sp. NBC_00370]|uniref:DUF5707 domain-containing protein n=1 Tax=Streptomyces sp. NBC_00370 TaxID=2975728 RepID=UPI002E26A20E
MRIRAAVAVVSGALALSALTMPASQAAPSHARPGGGHLGFTLDGHTVAPQAKRAAAASVPTIDKVVVNAGAPTVVGAAALKTVTVSVTASDDSGISDASTFLWIGADVNDPDAFGFDQNEEAASCVAASATTSTCTLTVSLDPGWMLNTDAQTWHASAAVLANDGDVVQDTVAGSTAVQRLAKLTADVTPEPPTAGSTVTITGLLTRANWETRKYEGYAGRSVRLQFRPPTTTTYANVKGIKSTTTGSLKTTSTATVTGFWRFDYLGDAVTNPISSPADGVTVK